MDKVHVAIDFFNTHKAAIAAAVLAYHTVVKAVQDSLAVRKGETGFGLILNVLGDVLGYIGSGKRA